MGHEYSCRNIIGTSERIKWRSENSVRNVFTALLITALLAATTARAAVAASAPIARMPGAYAIRTSLKNTYLTARPGNHTIDAVITSAATPGPNERFSLYQTYTKPPYTLIKTTGGYYVSAAAGGGLGAERDSAQMLQTERTEVADDALFRISTVAPGYGGYAIQTFRNYYLTALGGGGKPTGAFHTDATQASTWEGYWVTQCGDIGSGYNYAIVPKATSRPLTAIGGKVKNAVSTSVYNPLAARFKLIRQPSTGYHALQLSNGINYVTAVNGGGVAKGTPDWDNLATNRTQVQAWETFAFMEQGNCSYTIQTSNGSYVGVNPAGTNISTAIANPKTGANLGYSVYFELMPFIQ